MKLIWLGVAVLGLLFSIVPGADGHHSFTAEFDQTKPITLKGAVTKVLFENPHTYVYIDVKDADGKVENWAIEGGSTVVLYRQGWRKDTVKPGDTVTIMGYRAKNGSNLASSKKVILPDGREVFGGTPGDTGPDANGSSGDGKK
jgi:hypothetical protein